MQNTNLNNAAAAAVDFDQPKYFRASDGVYKRIDSPWGVYYAKVPDPKGKEKPPQINEFQINPDFSKLPAHLLQAIITLFRQYLRSPEPPKHKSPINYLNTLQQQKDETTEVQVSLLRKEDDPDVWKVVVPKQIVGAVTVDATLAESCDILTGEEYNVFPPIGWVHAGSCHSHHSMPCFWSGRDDQGELGVPGMHCTVGYLTNEQFGICCSIVLNKKRYVVDPPHCLDLSKTEGAKPIQADRCRSWTAELGSSKISDKVHSYISKPAPKAFTYTYIEKPVGNKPGKSSKSVAKVGTRLKGWDNWNELDWAPQYNYEQGRHVSRKDDWSTLGEYLDSSALRYELQIIMDFIYANNQSVYAADEPFSPEQLEMLVAARDFLRDVFDVLSEHPGSELAVICALYDSFGVKASAQILDLLDYLGL